MTARKPNWLLPTISLPGTGPLYQQIIDGLKREISEGRLPAGTPLPSFRQLAEQLMVSLITVKRAYEELEREGIIFRRQGLGTFVAEKGDDRSREIKAQRAEQLMREAIREATEAGLKEREIIEMFRHLNGKRQS
jgi:GntR family transcriptional regulator